MNVASILAAALQKVPAWLRFSLLVVFALTVVVVAILRIFHVDLPYDEINQTLVLIGGYLGVQSAANVPGTGKRARE
jgi:hypothetical protein